MDNWADLPRLPAPFVSRRTVQFALGDNVTSGLFSADQMRAYARAAVEAEREACAKLCKDHQRMREATGHPREAAAARKLSEMIQQRGKS